MFNVRLEATLKPGQSIDGKSHKFTEMANGNRKNKSASSNPYDTQWKFHQRGFADRTFQIRGNSYNQSRSNVNSTSSGERPDSNCETSNPAHDFSRPATVDPSSQRPQEGPHTDQPMRPMTVGLGTLSSTGTYDGPYHYSPKRMREKTTPSVTFTATNNFFADGTAGSDKITTMHTATFINNNALKKHVQSKTEDDFVNAFMNYADCNGFSVSVFDIEELIKEVLGDDTPRWILDIFIVMSRNKSEFRRVKLTDFRRIVPVALKAVNSYFNHSKQGPAYTKSENVKHIRQPLSGSSYQNDFETPKNIWYSTKFPMTAAVKKSTQSASNQLLFKGTTKATLHPPGYIGHIPANRAIPNKEDHCNGEKARPRDFNLTLTYPVLGRLPGYCGHIPRFPTNQKKEKL